MRCDETVEYSICDGWPEMLTAGDFGDCMARNSLRGILELGTEATDEHDNSLILCWKCC